MVCQDSRRTYAELGSRCRRLAGGMRKLGMAPHDRVGVIALNSDRYLELYLGLPAAGYVLVPVNSRLASAEMHAILASDNGLAVSLHQANVGNPGDCQRVVNEALRHYGRIDYLVNNAGAVHDRTALKMSLVDWEQVIRVDLSGPFYMSKAVLPTSLSEDSGA